MPSEHAVPALAGVWHDLPHAWGGPCGAGRLRAQATDFRVAEIPVTEPDGAGEHLWLYVRKTDANTDWVARALARHTGVAPATVGFAGMKDRHAVTEQWFSLQLPGQADPDWSGFAEPGVEILRTARHSRKLKRGGLRGNRFEIRVRDFAGDRACAEQRLARIASGGVPNYFGDQRFGRDGANLARAQDLFAGRLRAGRTQRGLYLSAARSALFNQVLSERVQAGNWCSPLPGEVMQLDGRTACFKADPDDTGLMPRLETLDIHCTGPLWGRGDRQVGDAALAAETAWLAPWTDWCAGLEQQGLEAARRSLRLRVDGLTWHWEDEGDTLALAFALTSGGFATAVLREIVASE